MSINPQRLNRSVKHLNKFRLFALFLCHCHIRNLDLRFLPMILFVSFKRKVDTPLA